MSEILDDYKPRRRACRYLILDCGHWFKWTGGNAPKVGAEFDCPSCKTISVVRPQEKPLER